MEYPPLPRPGSPTIPIRTPPNSNVVISEAVNEAIIERDAIAERKLKLMIHNMKEAESAAEDVQQVQMLITEKLNIEDEITITQTTRLGAPREDDKPRLLRIELATLSQKRKILSKATQLRNLEEEDDFAKVYIRPDLTPKQQTESKNLYERLKQKRLEDPDNTYVIRKQRIIKLDPVET